MVNKKEHERCSAATDDDILLRALDRIRAGLSNDESADFRGADPIADLKVLLADYDRLRSEPQSSGMWQPIETAPQDGSYVLLFNALGNHAVSRWGMRYLGDPGPEAWVCDGKYIPNPTHWCPLTRPKSRSD